MCLGLMIWLAACIEMALYVYDNRDLKQQILYVLNIEPTVIYPNRGEYRCVDVRDASTHTHQWQIVNAIVASHRSSRPLQATT